MNTDFSDFDPRFGAALDAGDIHRCVWPGDDDGKWLNLYLGSGRCGACFDRWGLMNVPTRAGGVVGNNPTHLMHADHWNRDELGLDSWQPVFRLQWADKTPTQPSEYQQHLSLQRGTLTTTINSCSSHYRIRSAFDPYDRDVLGIEVNYSAETSDERLPPMVLSFMPDERPPVPRRFRIESTDGEESAIVHAYAGTADSRVVLNILSKKGRVQIDPSEHGLQLNFDGSAGEHLLLITVAASDRSEELKAQTRVTDATAFFDRCAAHWRQRYGSAYLHLPVPEHQALWARSLFYVLSSYGPDVRAPAPPMGWAGLAWGYDFPQDLSYVLPALLRLGHLDIARAWVEFFYACRETCEAFTRHVYHVDGIFGRGICRCRRTRRCVLNKSRPNININCTIAHTLAEWPTRRHD